MLRKGLGGEVGSHSRRSRLHKVEIYLHRQYCATVKSNNATQRQGADTFESSEPSLPGPNRGGRVATYSNLYLLAMMNELGIGVVKP